MSPKLLFGDLLQRVIRLTCDNRQSINIKKFSFQCLIVHSFSMFINTYSESSSYFLSLTDSRLALFKGTDLKNIWIISSFSKSRMWKINLVGSLRSNNTSFFFIIRSYALTSSLPHSPLCFFRVYKLSFLIYRKVSFMDIFDLMLLDILVVFCFKQV